MTSRDVRALWRFLVVLSGDEAGGADVAGALEVARALEAASPLSQEAVQEARREAPRLAAAVPEAARAPDGIARAEALVLGAAVDNPLLEEPLVARLLAETAGSKRRADVLARLLAARATASARLAADTRLAEGSGGAAEADALGRVLLDRANELRERGGDAAVGRLAEYLQSCAAADGQCRDVVEAAAAAAAAGEAGGGAAAFELADALRRAADPT